MKMSKHEVEVWTHFRNMEPQLHEGVTIEEAVKKTAHAYCTEDELTEGVTFHARILGNEYSYTLDAVYERGGYGYRRMVIKNLRGEKEHERDK